MGILPRPGASPIRTTQGGKASPTLLGTVGWQATISGQTSPTEMMGHSALGTGWWGKGRGMEWWMVRSEEAGH